MRPLTTPAGHLGEDDEVVLRDEHLEQIDMDDEPDVVVIPTYIILARRPYGLADRYCRQGAWVALGGHQVSSLPGEGAYRSESIFRGAVNKDHSAAGWKKFESFRDWIIRSRQVLHMRAASEQILRGLRWQAEQIGARGDLGGLHERTTVRGEAA